MDFSYISGIFSQRSNINLISRDLHLELQNLKEKLHKINQDRNFNLGPLTDEKKKLNQRADDLNERILSLGYLCTPDVNIQLDECTQKISELGDGLNENQLLLNALACIEVILSNLDNGTSNLKAKFFHECAQNIQKAQKALDEVEIISSLPFIRNLQLEAVTLREQLLFEMKEIWSAAVKFMYEKTVEERYVNITIDTSLLSDVKQVIRATYIINDTVIIEKFFKKLKDSVMLPLVSHDSVVSIEEEISAVLRVSINQGNKPVHYKTVFQNVVNVVKFFRTHLNVNIEENADFMQMLGLSMVKDLMTCLMKNCLSHSVQTHQERTECFSQIAADAEQFELELQRIGFFPQNYTSFLKESEENNVYFANKMYLSYLDHARLIMKKDLHNTLMSTEVNAPDWSVLPTPVVCEIKNIFNIGHSPVLQKSYLISKSAHEVLELVDSLHGELLKSSSDRALRILYTIRNIFEIYAAVVPIHHRKLLDSLPQQIAFLHNNCLFFANRLLVLGCTCRTWGGELRSHYYILLDEAIALRQLAAKNLENCVSDQRSRIVANVYESGLSALREGADLGADTERSFRQCIRQLELLRNVWCEILPDNVYVNTMGYLIDEFTQAVVGVIAESEDISAQAANELLKILKIIEDRLPKLFNEPKEVYRLCRKWDRYQNLMFILGNNLDKISERWASGLGPLAHAFTKMEVQRLVRALFQNTDRRSIVLSQIYNS